MNAARLLSVIQLCQIRSGMSSETWIYQNSQVVAR